MATVNKPTDVKQKEADVNRKLQLYGIFSAFQTGRVPSNEQIDVALNSFLASKVITEPSPKLSAEGKALVGDLKELVTQAKHLFLSKNEGNLLQDFIWQTTQFDPKVVSKPGAPVDKDTAKKHGDQALEGFRTLGTLLITNGQFRKLLNDAVLLLRDMAGDAATNAASRVKPSEEALSRMDHPAEDNTWHEKPQVSRDNIKSQLQSKYKGDANKDAQVAAAEAAQIAKQDGLTAGLDTAKAAASDRVNENVPGETQEQAKDNQKAAKKKAAEYRARTKEYLSTKVPRDRREQTIFRLKKMILECQQHPDYQQAITTLLDLAERYGTHGRSLTSGSTGTVKETRTGLAQAEFDLKTLIERFANGTSSDDLWSAINKIYEDADRDPELKGWFKAMDGYVRRLLQEQGYILEPASTQEWNRLYDSGNYLLRQKYRAHTDRVIDEVRFLGHQFDEDPMNKNFSRSLTKLFRDLGNDANGKPVFKPHLVKDLTEIILPAAFQNVAYVPIPRIEYSDSQIDAVVENLVLESDNFMPNVLEIASDHYFRWGRSGNDNKNQNAIDVKVAGIQMDLRDVSYYVKRKQGFPALTDKGVANVFMGGDGFSFRLKLSTAGKTDSQNFFKIDKVDVDVKHLKIKVVKSNHKALFGLVKPVMLKVLRPVVQKVAEKQIKEQFNQFDQLMYQVKIEADRALDEAREDPENAPNIYQRYVTAVQKQLLQGKQKAEETVADKKVNMAITKEDSIFPDIDLPGGISSKATEYKQLAAKGEKWESPVFSIGNAPKSTDIPAAPQITRKSHNLSSSTSTTHTGTHVPATNGHALNGHNKQLSGSYPLGTDHTKIVI